MLVFAYVGVTYLIAHTIASCLNKFKGFQYLDTTLTICTERHLDPHTLGCTSNQASVLCQDIRKDEGIALSAAMPVYSFITKTLKRHHHSILEPLMTNKSKNVIGLSISSLTDHVS